MKRLSMILLGVLALPAYGGIASKEYVDSQIGEVSATISAKADKTGYTANMLLQTGDDGKITATTLKTNMIETGAVTNSKLASNIGLDKLDVGTLPTSGKHIMIWNSGTNKYVFEELINPVTGLQCNTEGIGCVTDLEGTTCAKYPEYDIGLGQCIDSGVEGSKSGYYSHDGTKKFNETQYNLSAGEWATEFSYGTIKGSALCSSTNGTKGQPGDPDEMPNSGKYCWYKMTSPAVSRWVFGYSDSSADGCASSCAPEIGLAISSFSDFRSDVFSSVGN